MNLYVLQVNTATNLYVLQVNTATSTLTRKGKRCSRIATILTCPSVPLLTMSISLATGGIYLYSNPTCTSMSGLCLAASMTCMET